MRLLARTFETIVCLVLLAIALTAWAPNIQAEATAQISIDPAYTSGMPGDVVTITVTAADLMGLYGWQVALKYNATVANCTAVWIPDDSVFAGRNVFSVEPVVNEPTLDGLNYLLIGLTLTTGTVDVTNGTLFQANFTILTDGETSLLIATRQNPVQFSPNIWDVWYSLFLDANQEEIAFGVTHSAITSGEFNSKPLALFSVVVPTIDNSTYLIIRGPAPAGVSSFVRGYSSLPTLFNASASFDHDGYITKYVWDFGDLEQPVETQDPTIAHTYNATGKFLVTLTVWDNGTPPLSSDVFSQYIIVDLLLQYYDWTPFIYGVLGLLVAAIVILSARRFMKRKQKFPTLG